MTEVEKDVIRREMLKRRQSYLPHTIHDLSRIIGTRLLEMKEYKVASTISSYVSKESEVDTRWIINEALAAKKRVLVPFVDISSRSLNFSEIRDPQRELVSGTFSVLEPKVSFRRPASLEDSDLNLIPGVAWDERGFRVGYGGGYYDRCLTKLKRRVPCVGLAFDFQVLPQLPISAVDVGVDMILTDRRLIRSGSTS